MDVDVVAVEERVEDEVGPVVEVCEPLPWVVDLVVDDLAVLQP